jgi:outer membrane biogenesis lipoprotein LolB
MIACTGCATLWPPPSEDTEARRLIGLVQNHNAQLNQYKALASVRLDTNRTTLSGRVAMAAVLPDKLRLEVLSTMGQPSTRLTGDGRHIALGVAGERRIRRMPQTPQSLEPLIHIPIGIEELQSLTTGRPKLPAFVSAQILDRDDRRVVIALKDRWHRLMARIDVEPVRGRLIRMENLDRDEQLVYAIHWQKWEQTGSYEIPQKVELITPTGRRLELSMVRFWPDVDVPPSMFQLLPKENDF